MTSKNILSLCVIIVGIAYINSILFNLPGQNILAASVGACIGMRLGAHLLD